MTAYVDPLTGELRCATCGGPGKRVFVGTVETAGHSVIRRNGDKHPFRVEPSSRASQQGSPPRTLPPNAGSPLSTARLARTVE